MITALSVLLWFISQHPLLTFFAAMVLAGLVSWWRRFPGYAIVAHLSRVNGNRSIEVRK